MNIILELIIKQTFKTVLPKILKNIFSILSSALITFIIYAITRKKICSYILVNYNDFGFIEITTVFMFMNFIYYLVCAIINETIRDFLKLNGSEKYDNLEKRVKALEDLYSNKKNLKNKPKLAS